MSLQVCDKVTNLRKVSEKNYVFYKYVFQISTIAPKSFLAYCQKAMPTFMQLTLCSNLFSEYENNCIKAGMALQQLAKNESNAIENTNL